jgi:predicted transport protein
MRSPAGCLNSRPGRRRNGDVEVMLNSVDELPYIMTMVKQALDRQLYNGEA